MKEEVKREDAEEVVLYEEVVLGTVTEVKKEEEEWKVNTSYAPGEFEIRDVRSVGRGGRGRHGGLAPSPAIRRRIERLTPEEIAARSPRIMEVPALPADSPEMIARRRPADTPPPDPRTGIVWHEGDPCFPAEAYRSATRRERKRKAGPVTRVRHPEEQGPCDSFKKTARKSTAKPAFSRGRRVEVYSGPLFHQVTPGTAATEALAAATRRVGVLAVGGRELEVGEVALVAVDPPEVYKVKAYLTTPMFPTTDHPDRFDTCPTSGDQVVELRILGGAGELGTSMFWLVQVEDNAAACITGSVAPLRLLQQRSDTLERRYLELRVEERPRLAPGVAERYGLKPGIVPALAGPAWQSLRARCNHAAPGYDPHELCAMCRVWSGAPHSALGAHLYRGYTCDRCVTSDAFNRYLMAGDELVVMRSLVLTYSVSPVRV